MRARRTTAAAAVVLLAGCGWTHTTSEPGDFVADRMQESADDASSRMAAAGIRCAWERRSDSTWECQLTDQPRDTLVLTVWTHRWTDHCWIADMNPLFAAVTLAGAPSFAVPEDWVIRFGKSTPRTATERISLLEPIAGADPSLFVDTACD